MTSLADEECRSLESSEDSFEELKELESNLYSMIHYNNLSEIIASDLPDGFKIDIDKSSNEIIVSLKESDVDFDNTNNTDKGEVNQQPSDTNVNNNNESIGNKALCDKVTNNIEENSGHPIASYRNHDSNDSDVEIIEVSQNMTPNKILDVHVDKIEDISIEIIDNTTCKSDNSLDCSLRSEKRNTEISKDCAIHTTSNDIEEIVISSEEDSPKHENKNNIKKNKRRRSKMKKSRKTPGMVCPKKWNASMIKFYSKISRSKLEFDSAKLIKKMRETLDKKQWFVGPRDYDKSYDRSRKFRCRRCRQFGHEVRDCTEPYKPTTCYMCGDIGHRENRCPQRKCLTCGRVSSVFVQMCSWCTSNIWKGNLSCNICHSKSHNPDLCPDVWRGLHMTTNAGALVIPSRQNLKKICCNCGMQGHMDFECHEINNSVYVINDPTIRNYINIAKVFTTNADNLSMLLRLDSQDTSSLSSKSGYDFLQNLSNTSQTRLELEVEEPARSLTIIGSDMQCKFVIESVRTFLENNMQQSVPFHKHKKKLHSSKKRRTL